MQRCGIPLNTYFFPRDLCLGWRVWTMRYSKHPVRGYDPYRVIFGIWKTISIHLRTLLIIKAPQKTLYHIQKSSLPRSVRATSLTPWALLGDVPCPSYLTTYHIFRVPNEYHLHLTHSSQIGNAIFKYSLWKKYVRKVLKLHIRYVSILSLNEGLFL